LGEERGGGCRISRRLYGDLDKRPLLDSAVDTRTAGKAARNSAEDAGKTRATTATTASARGGRVGRGRGREREKKGSNDWLDTSCRTEATVGLIKLRELAEVSSGLFRGIGNGEARKGRMTAGERERERERERV